MELKIKMNLISNYWSLIIIIIIIINSMSSSLSISFITLFIIMIMTNHNQFHSGLFAYLTCIRVQTLTLRSNIY